MGGIEVGYNEGDCGQRMTESFNTFRTELQLCDATLLFLNSLTRQINILTKTVKLPVAISYSG